MSCKGATCLHGGNSLAGPFMQILTNEYQIKNIGLVWWKMGKWECMSILEIISMYKWICKWRVTSNK